MAEPALHAYAVESLHFDPENPRIPSGLDGEDDQALVAWMLEDANLLNLMRSIGTHGYFAGEPLLIVPRSEGGRFTVVEGNRRLAALRLLSDPSIAPKRSRAVANIADAAKYRPTSVPCVLFDSRQEVMGYLGYRHITGIQEWSPLAKARYLDQLWEQLEDDPPTRRSKLADRVGTNADYVARLLTALELFRQMETAAFFDIEGLEEETISFSLLVLGLNYSAIIDYIGLESARDSEMRKLDIDRLENLARWLYAKRDSGKTTLIDSRNMKLLNAVLAHADSARVLEDGATLREAVERSEHPRKLFRSALRQARDSIKTAHSLVGNVREATREESELLDDIGERTADLRILVDKRMMRAANPDRDE